ncbi:hypothetical protein PHYBOEH_000040 [Phytophthora boehmeriae]|uniref:FAM32A-like protein n=1 Tax=Phytophthora boehmeriae TaxID=109152 RepID=A0A8T1X813_9STRA|nr:hypothetical protein PHYBOEH_000040 [Phytophthora boehmeriae]
MENVKRGKLKLKNSGGLKVASSHKHKKSKKKSKRRAEEQSERVAEGAEKKEELEMTDLTPAQRRHAEHQKKREQEEIEKAASKTYRERIEDLNQYLGSLTEHHDVPRVSAAGNG